MADPTELHKKVFSDYTRAVVHLRCQLKRKRFGIVFGAGVSKPFNIPDWGELIERISSDSEIDGDAIIRRFSGRSSLPYKTELLFQHFRRLEAKKFAPNRLNSLEFENRVFARWFRICSKHLYEGVADDFSAEIIKHPYLVNFVPLVQDSQLTVTYNFDDYLEKALVVKKRPRDKSRGFETVTNPWNQFRLRSAVVYHPSGVIPRKLMEHPRDRFVFSESSFAEQFMNSLRGDNAFLINHFSKNTCLIVGSSLEDETLRNILIRNASQNPGNSHYYVHFLRDDETIDPADKAAITEANFNVYNLVTLFLKQEEIAALADLINREHFNDNVLKDVSIETCKPVVYRYYLTGPIGVGKTTTVSQLQNLTVIDEWMEARPDDLAKPPELLTEAETKRADEWIVKQFEVKNTKLRHKKIGIFVVDRPPLDPLSFTLSPKRQAKAVAMLNALSRQGNWPVEDGTVVRLIGNPDELAARVVASGRETYDARRLEGMQKDLDDVYGSDPKEGYIRVDARGMTIGEVTKRVAHILHFEEYKEYGLEARLRHFKDNPSQPTTTRSE